MQSCRYKAAGTRLQVQGCRCRSTDKRLEVQGCRYRAADTGLQLEGCKCSASTRVAGAGLQVQISRYRAACTEQLQGCRCKTVGTYKQVQGCRCREAGTEQANTGLQV